MINWKTLAKVATVALLAKWGFQKFDSMRNMVAEEKHDVEDDIHHIVEVNYKAMETMIHLLAEKRAEFRLKHS